MSIVELFERLKSGYGEAGWWPLLSRAGAPGYDSEGYHPGIVPDDLGDHERFEITAGAILTQNTAWRNVEPVMTALHRQGLLDPERMARLEPDDGELKETVRSCGYFNQKAKRLVLTARAMLDAGFLGGSGIVPRREELLAFHGIGPETADSILLYGWNVFTGVADAYAIRLLSRLGYSEMASYEECRRSLMEDGPADAAGQGELHGLIVGHCKRFCLKRPLCGECFLNSDCRTGKKYPGEEKKF